MNIKKITIFIIYVIIKLINNYYNMIYFNICKYYLMLFFYESKQNIGTKTKITSISSGPLEISESKT